MIHPNQPALALAPMDGITDAPMRELQGATGAFSYAVSEFLRVSIEPLPVKVFRRDVPELANQARTPSGLPVQVQLLGGDPERMAISASRACRAGAKAIDINFGCPAPVVNRHDGGASLLRCPSRIKDIVRAVREAVPTEIPVSAKLRLGWDSIDAIHETAAMAAEGGAAWLTVHARTRTQGYAPPVYWKPIRKVREDLGLPVVANGDIFTLEDFLQCQEDTESIHFMIGRGALANPLLAYQIAKHLGLSNRNVEEFDWTTLFKSFTALLGDTDERLRRRCLMRLKQWMKLANNHGNFQHFDALKHTATLEELFDTLGTLTSVPAPLERVTA